MLASEIFKPYFQRPLKDDEIRVKDVRVGMVVHGNGRGGKVRYVSKDYYFYVLHFKKGIFIVSFEQILKIQKEYCEKTF